MIFELSRKPVADKGIGSLRNCKVNEVLDEYFDKLMIFGFERFFPEIFREEDGPVRHKCWSEQASFELGEKAVRRCVARVVLFLYESQLLTMKGTGSFSDFPIFADWLRQNEEGSFTTYQIQIYSPTHLQMLGWYIENAVGVTDYIDGMDEVKYTMVLEQMESVRVATLSQKAAALGEALEPYRKEISETDPDDTSDMVDRNFPSPSSTLISALAGKIELVYVPVTNSGTYTHYGPLMVSELQELIRAAKGGGPSNQEAASDTISGVISELEGMRHRSEEEDGDVVPETQSHVQQSSVALRGMQTRRLTANQGTPVEEAEFEESQVHPTVNRKNAGKQNKKFPKVDPEVRYGAAKIDGVNSVVKLAMNISIESLVEGIPISSFQAFMSSIKQVCNLSVIK